MSLTQSANLPPFSSQFYEDAHIYRNLNNHHTGVFCEVGAFDGLNGSNTLFFERLGWRGFLVEPDPEIGLQCRANRKAQTFIGACGIGPPQQRFLVNKADRGTSMLHVGGDIVVQVRRLDDLMVQFGYSHFDLLSVDTEGTEVDVLSTLGDCRPGVIIAEFWSQPAPPAPEPLLAWARGHGYREAHRTTANLILVKI